MIRVGFSFQVRCIINDFNYWGHSKSHLINITKIFFLFDHLGNPKGFRSFVLEEEDQLYISYYKLLYHIKGIYYLYLLDRTLNNIK